MPDFTNTNLPATSEPIQTGLSQSAQDPDSIRKAAAQQALAASSKNQPLWMSKRNQALDNTVNTKLTDTLRYDDPNLGYDATDKNMEDEYANSHPIATFRNNLIKGTANFVGGGIESLATIPIAIGSLAKGDFSYNWDNPLTNEVQSTLKQIETALPTYQTNYERDNPIAKYLNPLEFKSFLGAVGGQVNNFAGATGYLAGAYLEDALITAATGGLGLLPAMAAQGVKEGKFFSSLGRAVATEPQEVSNIVKGLDEIKNGERSIGIEGASQPNINASKTLESAVANARNDIYDVNATKYKVTNLVKYNLALLTSATSQGVFQAADNYNDTKKELSDQVYEKTGRVATADELAEIDNQSKLGANLTLGSDIALLYLSNKIRFGSLFQPTEKVFDSYLTGWGKNIAKGSVTLAEDEEGNLVRTLSEKTPETKIGRLLLNAERAGGYATHSIVGAAEFAGLNAVSTGVQDYIKNKYNAQNRGEVGDFIQSFLNATKNTPNTNQGLDSIVNGLLGGLIGGVSTHAIEKFTGNHIDPKEQLQHQVDILNSVKFRQIWEDRIKTATTDISLGKQHKDAVEQQDIFKAKSLKDDLLVNYFLGASKVGKYDARVEEVKMLKELTGDSFKKLWGTEDTPENRAKANDYLNNILEKGKIIKNNTEKIQHTSINPFDPKTQGKEYSFYETIKDAQVHALSTSKFLQDRTKSVIKDLRDIVPDLDINNAVKLTSFQGLQSIAKELRTTSDNLGLQISQTQGNDVLQNSLYKKHIAVNDILGRMQPLLTDAVVREGKVIKSGFDGKGYIGVMRDLFDLHSGINYENNKYINKFVSDNTFNIDKVAPIDDEKLADNLEKLQDLYKLDKSNTDVNNYYNILRTGRGASDAMNTMDNLAQGFAKFQKENGELQTPEIIKEDIRNNEYGKASIDPEDTTAFERQVLKNAAEKVVNGEKLTNTEETLSNTHEKVFTNYVKIEQNVKNSVDEHYKNEESKVEEKVVSKNEPPKTVSNKEFIGASPENMMVGLYRSDYLDKTHNAAANLEDAIFNNSVKDFTDSVSAKLEKRPELKNGEQRKIQPLDKNNVNVKLFRKDFDEAIQINFRGKIIGELRPPDSILDVNNNSIFDKDGNLTITPENYENTTGNKLSTYNKFKENLENYKKSYDKLRTDLNTKDVIGPTVLNKYFKYTANLGSTIFNSAENSGKDVLLKDTKPKNKVVVEINQNTDGSYSPTILKEYGKITSKDRENIKSAVDNNPDHFSQYDSKIMAAFPVDGVVTTQSFIRGRLPNNEEPTKQSNFDNLKVATEASVFKNFTINFRPKIEEIEEEKPKEEEKRFSLFDKVSKDDLPSDDIDACNKQIKRKIVRKSK